MAWWHRDPSLVSRSLIHRYAQRLRDKEATRPTRCFSRTPPNSARHEDSGDGKRPAHMSDLEWMQLQHYDRWRKRLEADPYKMLFGASNSMLNGKGLLDWNWIHKTFPKWMLTEMEAQDQATKDNRHPEKVDVPRDSPDAKSKARAPVFPEPSFRKTTFERDASAGIESPSDVRRPRANSNGKVVEAVTGDAPIELNSPASRMPFGTPVFDHDTSKRPPEPISQGLSKADERLMTALRESYEKGSDAESIWALQCAALDAHKADLRPMKTTTAQVQNPAQEIPAEDSFADARSGEPSNDIARIEEDKAWRQTAMQRRAVAAESTTTPHVSMELFHSPEESPSPRVTRAASPLDESHHNLEQPLHESKQQNAVPDTPGTGHDSRQSPSRPLSSFEKLAQLPKEDIDFLSAADIRASMGAKRSRTLTDEQRQAQRQSLEESFSAITGTPNVDSMVEAQAVNKQQIRRQAREMSATQTVAEAQDAVDVEKPSTRSPAADVPIESSMDRLKRWLETTGASFANQFWQDPTEDADVTKTKLFFDKVANSIKKGQAATKHIADDLEKDIPASKPLLKRLKSDEQLLDTAIYRLRQRSPNGSQDLSPRKIGAMESFKTQFHQTNKELEKAYEALRVIAGTDAVNNATASFQRRLSAASNVLQKNAQLLRMLMWSLKTRLEDPNIERGLLSNYKLVADNLLSLRDTQMTLVRLVDRAMLVYRVPTATENLDAIRFEQSAELENCEDPFVRARLAADAHLLDEIKAHRTAKEAVAENQAASEPKFARCMVLEEPKPLAHSLFRPFAPAFEKLGSKKVQQQIKEDERKAKDAKLVEDVKQAYEDGYRKTAMEQQQVESAEVDSKFSEQGTSKSLIQMLMLKDDPEATATTSSTTDSVIHLKPPTVPSTGKSSTSTQAVATVNDCASVLHEAAPILEQDGTTMSPELATAAESKLTEEPSSAIESLRTHYTIVVYNPQTDALSITTSSSGPPRDTSPAVPLHQALSALESPSKFIPYITRGLEVVSAKKDMLVLRDAIDGTASTRPFETVGPHSEQSGVGRDSVNPIDGTTRLSPTGYVGPEGSAEQLENEFQARRHAAGKMQGETSSPERPRDEGRRTRQKGGAVGVAKTVIWVTGMCYVAGVIGEIAIGA
ncbi:hypothetical protein ACEQ8H_002936 [Pleosporales sp. CAS-2024a]